MEDPLAMSLASMIMSRPGSVMDDRPGSALSNFGALVSPTKTPVRNRGKLRSAMSMNSVDFRGKHGYQVNNSVLSILALLQMTQQETGSGI